MKTSVYFDNIHRFGSFDTDLSMFHITSAMRWFGPKVDLFNNSVR